MLWTKGGIGRGRNGALCSCRWHPALDRRPEGCYSSGGTMAVARKRKWAVVTRTQH